VKMRTLILGLDAFDPNVFERLSNQGRLPHLGRYAEEGGYSRFGVANPSQSEVSWTSIATGLNPGGHGIFDFVHRDPATYSLYPSLLPTKRSLGGTQFASPFTARTIFDQVASLGYDATSMWWPATFPARLESPVRTIPGLGTPDIQGKLGVGSLFTTEIEEPIQVGKTPHEPLRGIGKDRFEGSLKGPKQQTRGGVQPSALEFQVEVAGTDSARLKIGQTSLDLALGAWSPIFEVTFKLGRLVSVQTLARAALGQVRPHVHLYFLPLQLHPLHSPWPYASPGGFVKDTWRAAGPFLTLGWPQDTTGLEDRCISDDQFLALCDSIDRGREAVLMHHLKAFQEGLMGIVFDSLDRVQHMFWRDRPDVIDGWYMKLDALVGRVETELKSHSAKGPVRLFVFSDHGFARFDRKVHLNRWLIDHGYLNADSGEGGGKLQQVKWGQTQAYAIGLNSIYLNLAGREGKGVVSRDAQEPLELRIRDELLKWEGSNGIPVVRQVWRRPEVFDGKLAEYGPDLVVGFSPGFRASQENGLGQWSAQSDEPNRDHWGADHCIDPSTVPGVVFSNSGLLDFPSPTYRDVPAMTIGATPDPGRALPPAPHSEEDQEIVEERLRSLGYL
jgi:predicted AlkP superfamily phosphohydrolase/phosphomutase